MLDQTELELPAVVFATPSPKLDTAYAHNSHIGKAIGNFCGTPIVNIDEWGIEVDILRDVINRLAFSSGTSVPAEVLPGESICSDNIIRRTTTVEAIGYDSYHLNQELTEANTERVPIYAARSFSKAGLLITWRPNRDTNTQTEYALTHSEV